MMIQMILFFCNQAQSGSGWPGMTSGRVYIVPGSSPFINNQHQRSLKTLGHHYHTSSTSRRPTGWSNGGCRPTRDFEGNAEKSKSSRLFSVKKSCDFKNFEDFCADLNPGCVSTSWAYGSAVTSRSLETTKYNAKDVSRGQISVWSVSGDGSRGSEGSRSRQGPDWVLL